VRSPTCAEGNCSLTFWVKNLIATNAIQCAITAREIKIKEIDKSS